MFKPVFPVRSRAPVSGSGGRPLGAILAFLLLGGALSAGLLAAACLLPGALSAAGTGSAAGAASTQGSEDRIVLSRPWARLRNHPAETAHAIAIVYGNDVLAVLERKEGWLQVETQDKVRGWLSPEDATGAPARPKGAAAPSGTGDLDRSRPATGAGKETAAALPPLPARHTRPGSTDALRRLGYEEAARRRLTELLLHEHDSAEAYRATRDMLTYHPVGNLPPLQGSTVPKEDRDTARRLRESVLLAEGRSLDEEGKSWDAILLYDAMVQSEPKNGRAHLALLDTLTRFMERSAQSPNMENLGVAVSIYRKTYPDLALPPAVQARLKDGKK